MYCMYLAKEPHKLVTEVCFTEHPHSHIHIHTHPQLLTHTHTNTLKLQQQQEELLVKIYHIFSAYNSIFVCAYNL